MSQDKRQLAYSDKEECDPAEPAPQPRAPGGECKALADPNAPDEDYPEPCATPDPECGCPPSASADPSCLDDLITAQTTAIAAADKAKQFRDDLQKLADKVKAARVEYTSDKYNALLDTWRKQDAQIADLIRKLVCAVPCWRCVLECYVCPILNKVHDAEQRLWGGPGYGYAALTKVGNLLEMQAWRARDLELKEKRLDRINKVLSAWEKPAATIEKNLSDHAKLIDAAWKGIGTDAAKLVFDVFLKLVPAHLAVAPPAGDGMPTKIGVEYTTFCPCDEGEPDDCCGPDVGKASLRQRFIGPQPYLVKPADYNTLICCLVEHRLGPAQDAVVVAKGELQKVEDAIKQNKAIVDGWLATFEKDARNAIPSTATCKCGQASGKLESTAKAK